MLKRVLPLLCAVMLALPAQAEPRVTLGWGRMFVNDALGDGHDRWRTGGYTLSMVKGFSWRGALPQRPGEILEYRLSAQIVAPADLIAPPLNDRRYAALLSFGAHTQFDWRGNEIALGGDLVVTGPQTGISNFQTWIHHMIGLKPPRVVKNQIGNGIYPTFEAEMARRIAVGNQVTLRPFVQVQAGVESFVRVGGDLVIGTLGHDDLMIRDAVTGQRYRAVEGARETGLSLVLGADLARVFDNALLPDTGLASLRQDQSRLRAGVHWQGEKASLFYGVTYLSPEFDQQPEGQFVGALNLNLKF